MKMIYLLCAALSMLAIEANAQGLQLNWAARMGQEADEEGKSIAVDDQGNTYVLGTYRETSGGTVTEEGVSLSKQNAAGQFQWVKKIAGAYCTDLSTALALDASGNPIIIGGYYGTVDFDPGSGTMELTAQSNEESFIEKFDANGEVVWLKGLNVYWMSAVAVDPSGNLYIAGYFYSPVDFDMGSGTALTEPYNNSDAFLLKLDTDANFQWVETIDCSEYSNIRTMRIGDDGSVYLAGSFWDTLHYEELGVPGYSIAGGNLSTFFSKFDSNGQCIWMKTLLSDQEVFPADIALDASGNCYLTGFFYGATDFNPGPATYELENISAMDAYVARYDSQGNLDWVRRISGAVGDYAVVTGQKLEITPQNSIYVTGRVYGAVAAVGNTATFGLAPIGLTDFYLLVMDTDGEMLNAKRLGGSGSDFVSGMTQHNNGIYLTGCFQNSMDFDPAVTGTYFQSSAGGWDAFIMQLDGCTPEYGTDVVWEPGPYTWMDGFTYVQDNQTATYVLTSASGCDSIVTLNLAIQFAGLEDEPLANAVHVYPNPAQDVFFVESEFSGTLELRDATGRLVRSAAHNSYQTALDVHDLTPGMYTLMVDGTGGKTMKRIVIR